MTNKLTLTMTWLDGQGETEEVAKFDVNCTDGTISQVVFEGDGTEVLDVSGVCQVVEVSASSQVAVEGDCVDYEMIEMTQDQQCDYTGIGFVAGVPTTNFIGSSILIALLLGLGAVFLRRAV